MFTPDAAPSGLGQQRQTFSQAASYKFGLLVSPIITGVLAVAGLLILRPMMLNGMGPFQSMNTAGTDDYLSKITLILPAVFGFFTLLQLFRLRSSWGTFVTLYDNGLVFRVGQGPQSTWQWHQIRGLRQRVIQHVMWGVVPAGKTYQYWLTAHDNSVLPLDQNIANLAGLVDEIRPILNPLLMSRAMEAFLAGHTVLFGAVGVGPAGISCNGKTFAWDQIKEVSVSNGRLHISPKKAGFFGNTSADVFLIENIDVLLTLISSIQQELGAGHK